jgi:hypothetical protein
MKPRICRSVQRKFTCSTSGRKAHPGCSTPRFRCRRRRSQPDPRSGRSCVWCHPLPGIALSRNAAHTPGNPGVASSHPNRTRCPRLRRRRLTESHCPRRIRRRERAPSSTLHPRVQRHSALAPPQCSMGHMPLACCRTQPSTTNTAYSQVNSLARSRPRRRPRLWLTNVAIRRFPADQTRKAHCSAQLWRLPRLPARVTLPGYGHDQGQPGRRPWLSPEPTSMISLWS